MIDWLNVFFGALWILGLSLLLAAFSIIYYQQTISHTTWPELFATKNFQLASNVGLLLTCLGFAGQAVELWQQISWGILGVAFTYYAYSAFRLHR